MPDIVILGKKERKMRRSVYYVHICVGISKLKILVSAMKKKYRNVEESIK